MLRAQTAASALAAGLSVLSNFVAVALNPRDSLYSEDLPLSNASAVAVQEPPDIPFSSSMPPPLRLLRTPNRSGPRPPKKLKTSRQARPIIPSAVASPPTVTAEPSATADARV